jgi:hypothetical protein
VPDGETEQEVGQEEQPGPGGDPAVRPLAEQARLPQCVGGPEQREADRGPEQQPAHPAEDQSDPGEVSGEDHEHKGVKHDRRSGCAGRYPSSGTAGPTGMALPRQPQLRRRQDHSLLLQELRLAERPPDHPHPLRVEVASAPAWPAVVP